MSSLADLPSCSIPIITSVASYRHWRQKAYDEKKSVGFVATMGALHEGHAALVRRSLAENDLTVVSIFVNPAQFAPHEDLATYPRTLPHDLQALTSLSVGLSNPAGDNTLSRTPSAVFVPSVKEMYPSGITQTVSEQKGTFIEVKGYGHQMEGSKRPDFFRGVATVVTKLFNIIEPSKAYFGQKDIQQALLLRKLTRDLLLSHPTPENLHIVPTARNPSSSLALSSRNAYLSPFEREHIAPSLYQALQEAKHGWEAGLAKSACISRAESVIRAKIQDISDDPLSENKPDIKLDYIEMNDPVSFEILLDTTVKTVWEVNEDGAGSDDGKPVVLSGALWVGKTRLIDNIILGDGKRLGVVD